ncbi:MAG: alanine racemase [Solobacterium sp.]|nr:alanine racemase [Solobacterium sp.]
MHRDTWMEIDLDAVCDNVRRIKKICGKRIIAVVKANAYGCGDRQIAEACIDAGAEMLAVSSLDEALILRNEGITCGILIVGTTNPSDAQVMAGYKISAAAYSPEWVEAIAKENCAGLRVHLKVDTGMNRIGFSDTEKLKKAYQTLKDSGCIMEGIFTHFSCSDFDPDFTNRQFEKFRKAVECLPEKPEWIHCDNSDATVSFKDPLSNACRLGVSLYGVSSFLNDLKHPISLYSRLSMVKHVPAGEKIGYGATYETPEEEIIGTMPIGYADGFVRANQGRKVYIDGEYAEVVGRVCMDQTMIRLPREFQPGTAVEIFGPHIALETMAEELHTIPYEIICLITMRVTRVYRRSGKRYLIKNDRMTLSEL